MERKLVLIFILASACAGLAVASKTTTPPPAGLGEKTVKWRSATEHGEIKTHFGYERGLDYDVFDRYDIVTADQVVRSNKNPDTQWRTGSIVEYYKHPRNASQPWKGWVKEAMRTEFASHDGGRMTQMDLGYLTRSNRATVRILEVCDTALAPVTKFTEVVHEINRYRGPIEPLGGTLTLGEKITTITFEDQPQNNKTLYSKFDEQSNWHKADSFADLTDCKSPGFPFELVKKKPPLMGVGKELR